MRLLKCLWGFKIIFILEKKFQQVGGSVCEKIQTPDFKLGVTSNMNYKGFNVYMLWDWKQGGDIYNKNGQWLTRDDRHQMVDQAGKAHADKKTNTFYQSLYDANNQNQLLTIKINY